MQRVGKYKKKDQPLVIIYSNIQEITKKRENLRNIMEELDCDICPLAETMTNKMKLDEIFRYYKTRSIQKWPKR